MTSPGTVLLKLTQTPFLRAMAVPIAIALLAPSSASQQGRRVTDSLTANEIWRLLWHWPRLEGNEESVDPHERCTHDMVRIFGFARNPDAEGDLAHWWRNTWFWRFWIEGRNAKVDSLIRKDIPDYGPKRPFFIDAEDAFSIEFHGQSDPRYPRATLAPWSIAWLSAPDLHENLPSTHTERQTGKGVTFPRIVVSRERPTDAEYLVVTTRQRMYMICLYDRDQEFVVPRGSDEPHRSKVQRRAGALLMLMDREPLQVVRTGPNRAWRRDLEACPELMRWLQYQAEGVDLTAESLLEGVARSAGIQRRLRAPDGDTQLLGEWVLRKGDTGWQIAGHGEQHALPERDLIVLPCDGPRGDAEPALGADSFVAGRFGDFVVLIDGASSSAIQVDLR